MKTFRLYFQKTLLSIVFIGICFIHVDARAGVYDEFFAAIIRDNPSNLQSVLRRGMDANTPGPEGEIGLTMALASESMKAAQVLLSWPQTNVNALNRRGESPLMLAALKGHQDIVDTLIKKGADVNKTGWTPLHYAASGGHAAIIRLLLENHAYIDAESPNGSTPLMMAAMYGTGETVDLLIAEGADPQLKNQQGLTALQFAMTGERPDAIKSLSAVQSKSSRSGPAVAR